MATLEHTLTRPDLREEFDRLRSEIDSRFQHYATKADLARLEARLVKEISIHLRWMIGLQLVGLGAVAAIMRFLG